MSISATLKTNSSPKNALNKDLSTVRSINLELFNDADLLNPVFKISEHTSANYITVGSPFNRSYFINRQVLSNQYCLLFCSVDALESFKDSISGIEVMVSRNEKEYNNMLPDNLLPLKPLREYHVKPFENTVTVKSTEHYILGVI